MGSMGSMGLIYLPTLGLVGQSHLRGIDLDFKMLGLVFFCGCFTDWTPWDSLIYLGQNNLGSYVLVDFFFQASHNKLIVNWWFGARWFGFLESPFLKGMGKLRHTQFESQTTNRLTTNLPSVDRSNNPRMGKFTPALHTGIVGWP